MKPQIAIQLYTVRDAADADLHGTLAGLAEMGYKYVEAAGTYGLSMEQLAETFAKYGLVPISMHGGPNDLADIDTIVANTKILGIKYFTVAYIPEEMRNNAEAWKASAAMMQAAAEKLSARGVTLCYHNHSFEFGVYDGKLGLDLLYDNAPDLNAELDMYWVKHGKQDVVEAVKKRAGRLPLLHVKDMGTDGKMISVGSGTINWPEIFALDEAKGVEYLIVEQDDTYGKPMQVAKECIDYLKTLGY